MSIDAIYSRRSIRSFQDKEVPSATRPSLSTGKNGDFPFVFSTIMMSGASSIIFKVFFASGPELTAYLGTDSQLTGAIAVGYADEKPAQRPRKKLEEIG